MGSAPSYRGSNRMSLGVYGVSHIVARVDRLDAIVATAAAYDWPMLFQDRDAEIPRPKRELLRAEHQFCHSALFKAPSGPSLEFVEYPLPAQLETRNFQIEPESGLDRSGVRGVVLKCTDPVRSADFWRSAVGALPISSGSDGVRIAIRAPHPSMSLEISLGHADSSADDALDDMGWNCLAFLVRDAGATARRLSALGARMRIPYLDIVVGGRPLRLAMVHCPDGRVIELLEPPATRLDASVES